jgi:hypothetical protein
MNYDEHPDDRILTGELRDALTAVAAPERPPLAAIIDRGRAQQKRRLAGFAGLGVGVAACTALALGLTGVLDAAPAARSTGTVPTAAPAAQKTGTVRTAAFTLRRNSNGTDTLTLTNSQMFDAAALQRALAKHGVPALVKTGTFCWSTPAAPNPASIGVLTIRPPVKLPPPGGLVRAYGDLKPNRFSWIADHTKTVINPAAMPSGTELFFSYLNSGHALFFDLIYTKSYSCNNEPPANP